MMVLFRVVQALVGLGSIALMAVLVQSAYRSWDFMKSNGVQFEEEEQ